MSSSSLLFHDAQEHFEKSKKMSTPQRISINEFDYAVLNCSYGSRVIKAFKSKKIQMEGDEKIAAIYGDDKNYNGTLPINKLIIDDHVVNAVEQMVGPINKSNQIVNVDGSIILYSESKNKINIGYLSTVIHNLDDKKLMGNFNMESIINLEYFINDGKSCLVMTFDTESG